MRDLGFVGAMINGHTNGQYLDHPSLHPFWERAEALGAMIYLHPADPVAAMPVLEGTKGLKRAGWEWGVETGSHALRLVYSGHFDRFPQRQARARPSRRDPAVPACGASTAGRSSTASSSSGRPSDYIRDNIVVTISGMFSAEPLKCAISALGADRIMFATDYPFEPLDEASAFIDDVALAEDVRAGICSDNARRLLRLPA